MSSLAVSETPFAAKKAYLPRITERKCATCRNPEREAIDYALTKGMESYRVIGERYGLSITQLHNHKVKHLSTAIKEALAEEGVSDAKAIITHMYQRANILHDAFMDDRTKIGTSRVALEHEATFIKATGNWKESKEITLGGSIQLSAADKADADFQDYLRQHPIDVPGRDRHAHYMAWAEQKLLAEVQPALTADSIVETSIAEGSEDGHGSAV